MCGICGQISLREVELSKYIDCINTINNTMTHRGPDGSGIWYDDFTILGHRRLTIIDLSNASSQPFEDKKNKFVITYNGEIYNYIEIRNELIQKGYKFITSGDTEVLLKAYQEFGLDVFNKINGMLKSFRSLGCS